MQVVPGDIIGMRVERLDDDYRIRFTLDTGQQLEATGRSVYDPPIPFEDLADVFGFLIMQCIPAELVYRELDALDPDWEAVVAARRRANDEASRRARGGR